MWIAFKLWPSHPQVEDNYVSTHRKGISPLYCLPYLLPLSLLLEMHQLHLSHECKKKEVVLSLQGYLAHVWRRKEGLMCLGRQNNSQEVMF